MHVSVEDLESFVFNRLGPGELGRVLRHLLSGCATCRARVAPLSRFVLEDSPPLPDRDAGDSGAYEAAFDRAFRGVRRQAPRWRRERERIPAMLAALRACPVDACGYPRIRAGKLRPGWVLTEALLLASQEERFRDRDKMLIYALFASVMARHLDRAKVPPALAADLEARALAELGNAYRLNDQFSLAETSFAQAAHLMEQGSGDLFVIARLADLEASLRISQRRLPEARELLDHAERYYRTAGDLHLVGKILVQKGLTAFYLGHPREAVALYREGLAHLDPNLDPRLVALCQKDIVDALVDCGEHREASEILLRSGLRKALADDPLILVKLRWGEGRIAIGQGKRERAATILTEVRAEFLARGMIYDSALAGLELAGVWLDQGKHAAVREMAEEVVETFEDLGVHIEALRAVRFFNEASRRDQATVALVFAIVAFLRRLEWQPGLCFTP